MANPTHSSDGEQDSTPAQRLLDDLRQRVQCGRSEDEATQKELERYLAHAIGRKPTDSLYARTMHRR